MFGVLEVHFRLQNTVLKYVITVTLILVHRCGNSVGMCNACDLMFCMRWVHHAQLLTEREIGLRRSLPCQYVFVNNG